jgi:acetyl esterase
MPPSHRIVLTAILSSTCVLLAGRPVLAELPSPDLANFRYGPHERNVLDLWKAKSKQPTPLVAYFHGGGFDQGDKSMVDPGLIEDMTAAGVSVMSVNYRLTPQAKYPEHYLDCARAIQTARQNANAWNLDPKRVAATGVSAGGVVSLWLAFHDDLDDANSSDSLLRESSRVQCAAVIDTPVSLDPRDMRAWICSRAVEHRFFRGEFFGLKPTEVYTAAGLEQFIQASPLTFLTADDAPVYAFHHGPKDVPADITVTDAVHHYNSGVHLKQRMDDLKLECVLVSVRDIKSGDQSYASFLKKHLGK